MDNTKLIDCPEHPSEHKAVLYCYPDKYAGIWECDATNEGISDTHEHGNYEIEIVTSDHLGFSGHYQTDSRVYICGGVEGCGVTIDSSVADPDEDRMAYFSERDSD